jgi:UDP:flavonoid glycosyltransferase YjiC (YdhE family)
MNSITREEEDLPMPPKDVDYVIFVSLGTVPGMLTDLYREVIRILMKRKVFIYLSAPNYILDQLDLHNYKNIYPSDFLPQVKAIELSDFYIAHGGFNGLSESIMLETPMVIIPEMLEQKVNALRAEELGLAIYVKELKHLEENIDLLIENLPTYKARCVEFAKENYASESFDDIYPEIAAIIQSNSRD